MSACILYACICVQILHFDDKLHSNCIQVLQYRTTYYTYICDSSTRDIWLGLLYGYKAVLQIVALFLAFGTRKVNIKGLNDSTYIAATIYITSVILSVTIIACITLNQYVNTFACLIATSIFITATVILGLVFIPKVLCTNGVTHNQ